MFLPELWYSTLTRPQNPYTQWFDLCFVSLRQLLFTFFNRSEPAEIACLFHAQSYRLADFVVRGWNCDDIENFADRNWSEMPLTWKVYAWFVIHKWKGMTRIAPRGGLHISAVVCSLIQIKRNMFRPFAGDIKRAQKPEINWTLFLSHPRAWDGECKFLMTLMLFAVDKKINKNEMSSSVKKLEVTERKTRGKRTFPVPIDGIWCVQLSSGYRKINVKHISPTVAGVLHTQSVIPPDE